LVWDIDENREVYNFSTSKIWDFINGPNNRAGFILNDETYVNLDTGLINYFFEYKFTNALFYGQTGGYRINDKQDLILEMGNLITKETLLEVASLEELLYDTVQITEENINIERIRFQVDGSTSLHLYALEYDILKLILDHMEEKRPEYLTAILMKNNKNKSPLDITLDNESPKNTELLLRKLCLFKDVSLSLLFYDRFSELLAMNITAFHEYLDSCFFQTVQMKGIKYLKLKKTKDPWLVPHSSCLIDGVFVERYCKNDEKKRLELERKKKKEEEKLKAEKDKVIGEQNRIDEINQNDEDRKEHYKKDYDKEDKKHHDDSHMFSEDEDDIVIAKPKTKEEIEFEKERRKMKRLDIRAIEFDWIFNRKEGAAFMKTLAETQ
jgi:hypothetical protein